jgi:hypothetical protein
MKCTIADYSVAGLLQMAHQANREAIQWRKRKREAEAEGNTFGIALYSGQYMASRSYAKGILLALTQAREHKPPMVRRAERMAAEKVRAEVVV